MPTKFVYQSLTVLLLLTASPVYANNLTVSNVALGTRNPQSKTLEVKFNVNWENSWRNKINHDAAWLTLRLYSTQSSLTYKKLCRISASGLNPTGSSPGTAGNLEFYVPADKNGAFLRRSVNGKVGTVTTQNAQLTINYDSCGFSDSDEIFASVFGVEMVFIPQGNFYAGDFNGSAASLNRGSADSNPWPVTSESAIEVTNAAGNGFYYVSGNHAGENATGSTFTVPAVFPKGYASFYVMKYEINEGQWVEFFNALPSAESRANRDVTDNSHKNSDGVVRRNTIACSGTPTTCTTTRPSRAASFLSWMDVAAFLDWNALRPMTELEFEKIARGPILPVAGEQVWGTTDVTAAAALSGSEDGTETISTPNANAHFDNTTLSGGDTGGGAEHATGPLRNGIFATSDSSRVSAGGSYYGVLDLGGNLKERVVTAGNAAGLGFSGNQGDGVLTSAAGFEGNANTGTWPGLDVDPQHGITGATGSGLRGGSWADAADRLRTSDRFEAALTESTAANTLGGRGARTYDGN